MGPWGETPAARANWVDVAAGPPRRRALSVPRVARALDGRGAAELARHGVRGDVRRVHEYARAVGVEVRGHAVDLLHDLAHGVERAGRDLVARAVDLPLHVVGRADLVVVRRARGRVRVLGDVRLRGDVDHVLDEARLVVLARVVVDDDEDLTLDAGLRGHAEAEEAAEAVGHHAARRGVRVRPVDLVRVADVHVLAVFPLVFGGVHRVVLVVAARVLVAEVARRDVARELAAAERLDELVAALVERALVVVLRAQVPVDVGGALVDVTVDGGVRGEVGAELAHGADRDIRGRLVRRQR